MSHIATAQMPLLFAPLEQVARPEAKPRLSAEDCTTIFQAGLGLHNANLPIWDQRVCLRRLPANDLIGRLKGLSEAQQAAIWRFALLAEYGDGALATDVRPHRLMLGLMAHLAVMADFKGLGSQDLVPRITWSETASRPERFVRLLLAAAGCNPIVHGAAEQQRVSQLAAMAEPVFKKRSGQGGLRELRALAHKIMGLRDAELCARVESIPSTPRRPLPLSPLRSPRSVAGSPPSLLRRASQVPQLETLPAASTTAPHGLGSPDSERRSLIHTPSEDSYVAPYTELVDQLRSRYAQSRRPSQLSLSSSWAGVSDERSVVSEALETWQDIDSPGLESR